MRFLEPMTATILSLHRATDPYGLAGGEPGERGRNTVIRADGRRESLKGSDETEMQAGDVFLLETPGGGGYGKTAERREAAACAQRKTLCRAISAPPSPPRTWLPSAPPRPVPSNTAPTSTPIPST